MLASNRMRTLGWIAALLFAVLPCCSQTTLREQLQHAGIPDSSFSKAELDEIVDGVSANKDRYVYFAYLRTKGEMLAGYPLVLRYDQKTGAILRSKLQPDKKDECCGAPDGIDFADDYLLLSFHDNPSASSVLALDNKLQLVEILYGFGTYQIAPDQVVLTENMMHFAPVHPERLEFVDLRTGATKELYPPKGDALRERFAREHEMHMPSEEICRQLNDPCDPELYDEGISVLGTDRKGRFALVAGREGSHATKKDEAPATVASQLALYLYERGKSGWFYCEAQISEVEAKALIHEYENGYDSVKTRCVPDQPVVPDMSTSDFSPFPSPSRRVK